MMNENFILKQGWVKSNWYSTSTSYIHSKFNLVEHYFFIEMKINGIYVTIIENEKINEAIIFRGILKTNNDLLLIMRLLEFDF